MMVRRSRFVVLAIVIFAGLGLWLDYYRFLTTPLQVPQPQGTVEVARGISLPALARTLAHRGILKRPWYFTVLGLLRGDLMRLKAGTYGIEPEMLPGELLDDIVSGRVRLFPVTLIEGTTFRQVVHMLDQHPQIGGQGWSAWSDEAMMRRLGHVGVHPEGRYYPDTYLFPATATAFDVLERAMSRMDAVLTEEWARRADDLPFDTPYAALILASIIEKETAVADEYARIAGVFVRRLRRGMRLQTDPTVIYGLGEHYDGKLSRRDLREPTPYNTYVIDGLPPTPIALPGRAAIHAALHPDRGDSLYFVARGDGTHVFSSTLKAHNAAVRHYILKVTP